MASECGGKEAKDSEGSKEAQETKEIEKKTAKQKDRIERPRVEDEKLIIYHKLSPILSYPSLLSQPLCPNFCASWLCLIFLTLFFASEEGNVL